MNVPASALAIELRRRRAGRAELIASIEHLTQETWVPSALAQTPTPYLVLAAVSLDRRARLAARLATSGAGDG
ncbi:MAG: hypothetical protein ACR2H3_13305 [Acidimicrobiales bacterium]